MKLPDLASAQTIALDIETHDPDLLMLGPGARRSGYICGVSLAIEKYDKVFSWYFPLRHPNSENINEKEFYQWLAKTLSGKEIVCANAAYDFDFLQYKIPMDMQIIRDIQVTEFLIDSHAKGFSLDSLADRYLGLEKEKEDLQQFLPADYDKKKDIRSYISQMPSIAVEKYAKIDAELTLKVHQKQQPEIQRLELSKIYYIESRLIQVLLLMKKNGQRIDLAGLEKAKSQALLMAEESEKYLEQFVWDGFKIGSSADMAKLFDSLRLPYPATTPNKKIKNLLEFKPKPSFTTDFLQGVDHPIIEHLLNIKQNKKLDSSFLSNLEMFLINDRIHAQYHQVKIGNWGTEYGRLSCTKPAIQTMPGDKQPKLKKIVRSLFLPEKDHILIAPDFSQIDYRFFAHFAGGSGAKSIQDYFSDLSADMHSFTAETAGIQRHQAKIINFGIMFGMGVAGLSKKLNLSLADAQNFLDGIKRKIPALTDTPRLMKKAWETRGFVRTISGRRANLDNANKAHLAIVYIIAGSTADAIKKSMVDAFDQGLFNILIPHQSIHDELTASAPKTMEGLQAAEALRDCMQNVFKLRVPIVSSLEAGENWADLSENYKDLFFQKTCKINQ